MPPYVFVSCAALVGSAGLLWWSLAAGRGTRRAVARNLSQGIAPFTDMRAAVLSKPAGERAIVPAVVSALQQVRRITPVGMVESLERRILIAGLSATWRVERVLAAKLVLAAVGAVVGCALFLGQPSAGRLLLAGALVALLFFVPDALLSGRGQERQNKIKHELADTMDQLTIMVEAGLGFESATARAARTGKGPLADELRRVLQDMHLGLSRADALKALLDRTDVPELRQFVHAVVQADALGMPVARVLRVQAGELRQKRRQAAEERAMKLPVKVIFPLIICILPTVFIVVLGPGAIRIYHALIVKY